MASRCKGGSQIKLKDRLISNGRPSPWLDFKTDFSINGSLEKGLSQLVLLVNGGDLGVAVVGCSEGVVSGPVSFQFCISDIDTLNTRNCCRG